MAEKSTEERLKELEGHHQGVMTSLTTLQNKLDAALQKHADDAVAHKAEMDKLATDHAAALETLTLRHTAELKAKDEACAAALASQAEQLAAKHVGEIAALKEKVLVPALRDHQKRQAADLAVKHAAELDALK